jgi:hypothetical protein
MANVCIGKKKGDRKPKLPMNAKPLRPAYALWKSKCSKARYRNKKRSAEIKQLSVKTRRGKLDWPPNEPRSKLQRSVNASYNYNWRA